MPPLPKPEGQRRRKNLAPGTIVLPAAGRQGSAPDWPLAKKATKAELALWDELWHKPQAVEWERVGVVRVVARYAQKCILSERPAAGAALMSEVRQLEDRLLLSAVALARARYVIADVEADSDAGPAGVTQLDTYRRMAAGDE